MPIFFECFDDFREWLGMSVLSLSVSCIRLTESRLVGFRIVTV